MKKIIIFTIIAIITFSWLVTHNTTESEKSLLLILPLLLSLTYRMCKVSAITTSTDTKQNIPVVACKISITTAITSSTTSY